MVKCVGEGRHSAAGHSAEEFIPTDGRRTI